MGDLDMQKHHIISYDAATDKIVGDSKKDAVFFRKSARQYDGWLYSVSSLSEETECTTNHLWTVRWHEEAKNKFCVFFLMAENDIVISFSPLFRLDGSFYPQKEMETHRASNGWVIRVFDTEELARAYASYLLETFTLDTYTSIARCLRSLRRDIRFPFIAKDTEQIRFSTNRPMVVRACNLLNGVMNIPVLRDKPSLKITWGPVSVKSRYVNDITVISLDVPRYKHYVCGSTITHNCIYSFKGASADSFLTPLPEEQKRVLKQSYRLPQSVLKHASRWIERVSRREPKEYRPRNEEGIVERRPEITWKNPIGMLRVIEEALKKENSIMILASCSYMLPPTIKMLRENGIAFHNPWRKSRGDWNPLNAGKGVTSSRRLLSFLVPSIAHLGNDAHMWTREELSDWVFPLATEGVLKRAAKKHILDVPAAELDKELSVADLLEWFEESALDRALDTDIDWYCKHLLPKYQKAMAYPLEIMRRRGVAALSQKPLITIGTIHSVKGGEATHVILYPDISYSGAQEWQSGPDGRDAIVRMFYVGMTRARHTLTLCGPSTPLTVPIDII